MSGPLGGADGPQGFQGAQGSQGSQGSQGNQGAQGTQGVQGSQGTQGNQGAQGAQGAQGTQGFQGSQGTQGNQGFQGNQGTQGATGPTVAPVAWSGATTYTVGNLAVRAGSLFICTTGHTNHDPFVDCASTLTGSYWSFFSLYGNASVYNSGSTTVTATSLTVVDTSEVFCPGGTLLVQATAQWKLTGSSIVASSAAVKVDGSFFQIAAANQSGTPTTGAAVALGATGLFWGLLGPGAASNSLLAATTSATSDAGAPSAPSFGGTNGTPQSPLSGVYVGVGAHTVTLQAAAGNATTVVNLRERHLLAIGA